MPPPASDEQRAMGPVVVGCRGRHRRNQLAVLNISTLPPLQRREHGATVTSRIVVDALTAGAQIVMLQSSELGLGTYEQLGFRTSEMWKS